MLEFLEGFEKRMQIVSIIDSIINRKNRDMEIEKLFQDKQMENLVFSVLVFIMDKTLSEDEECTIQSITEFIKHILPQYYNLNLSHDMYYKVAEYIVKNILQNDGVPMYYPIIDYTKNKKSDIRIKLIDDKVTETNGEYKISYILTDQGYDFLFRTKEVDQEINFTIEEFKLRELIKRKNYKKALQQSRNLIQMVRQKKKDISQFIFKIRENIYDVEIDKFEELINSTYELLQEEYEILEDIKNMVNLSENRLAEEYGISGKYDDEMLKARKEILTIKSNINQILKDQRDLILDRHSLSTIYMDTIIESFSQAFQKRFDFENEILNKLEKCTESMTNNLWKLVNSLFLPNVFRNLNILNIYENQGKLKSDDDNSSKDISVEELSEDLEAEMIKRNSRVYIAIVNSLLQYAIEENNKFRFSEFIEYIKKDQELFDFIIRDKLLFTTMLKLYDMGYIDIEKWLSEQAEVVENATGEFDIEYCLNKISEKSKNIYGISLFKVMKVDDDTFNVQISRIDGDFCYKETIEVTDFLIEVDKNG